jgi:hypothetical protein
MLFKPGFLSFPEKPSSASRTVVKPGKYHQATFQKPKLSAFRHTLNLSYNTQMQQVTLLHLAGVRPTWA